MIQIRGFQLKRDVFCRCSFCGVFLQVGVKLDIQWSRLTETLPMSTHDVQRLRNFIIILNTSSYLELCRKVFRGKCDKL